VKNNIRDMYGSDEEGTIAGINPSISKLVLVMQYWGVKTISSHAGFFPGDEEEQEYFSQKSRVGHGGPVAVVCVVWDPPYVVFLATSEQVWRLIDLLAPGWRIDKPEYGLYDTAANEYRLYFTEFKDFEQFIKEQHKKLLATLPDRDDTDMDKSSADRYNSDFEAAPLTPEQFLEKRNRAIEQIFQSIHADILNHDVDEYKRIIDELIW